MSQWSSPPHTTGDVNVAREKRRRNGIAYIIHDHVKTGTDVLTQKRQHVVDFASVNLAEAQRERVTLQSLYEAIDTTYNRVEGCHKMSGDVQVTLAWRICAVGGAADVVPTPQRQYRPLQRAVA